MSENENTVGTLRLLNVSPESEEGIIGFLGRFYRGAKKEEIARLIRQLPMTLSRNVSQKTAQKVLSDLTALGATGEFVANRALNKTAEVDNEKATGQVAYSSLEKVIKEQFGSARLRFPVPIYYRLGLIIVALAMILLPLIYLGMIGGVVCLIFWHATANLAFFDTIHNVKAALLSYVAPLVIAVLLLFFMIKPLFARRHEAWKEIEIQPKVEPLLSTFIQQICHCVGAPMPTLIRFDNQVNASASFRRGFSSFFGNDLVLTIGLPLAGGLNLSEFAGVLAHEFGHFAQSSGMRLTYVIRSISAWFARVVYEEDEWDIRLRQWSKGSDIRIGVIFYAARLFIWLTRKVLWLLMQLGQLISCFMLRQMEFDADRYEAGLVGAEVFTSTSDKLSQLFVAHSWAFDDINSAWKDGRLPNNITAVVRLKAEQMEEKTRQTISAQQTSTKTGFFDTHPSDRDRIVSARKIAAAPLFRWPQQNSPNAAVLFKDFDALSRRASFEHYRQALGHAPDRNSLIDVTTMVQSQSMEQKFSNTLQSYFLGRFTAWRPLVLEAASYPLVPSDPKAALQRLKELRREITCLDNEHELALENYFKVKDAVFRAAEARSLLEAGFRIKAADFSVSQPTMIGVEEAEKRNAKQANETDRILNRFDDLYRERLRLGLALLQVPVVKERLKQDGQTCGDMVSLWKTLSVLQKRLPDWERLNLDLGALDILARQLNNRGDDEDLINAIRWKLEDLRRALNELNQGYASHDYPFEHSREGLTLGSYMVGPVPETDDLGAIFDVAGYAINSFQELSARLAGRLAEMAARTEMTLSLEPLGKSNEQSSAA